MTTKTPAAEKLTGEMVIAAFWDHCQDHVRAQIIILTGEPMTCVFKNWKA
jgi:hypothetical protein